MAALHAKMPGFVFTSGRKRVCDRAGLMEWTFVPPEEPERLAGSDVAICQGDRISRLIVSLKS